MSLETHLNHPRARGYIPASAHTGAAGGAACGDLIRISVALDAHGVIDAGFDASGCGSAIAAGSATVALIAGSSLLDGARVGAREISAELGGLSPGKQHAAELAADALHRALGAALRHDAQLPANPARVLVAMSGGVDSAVAATLCGEQAVGVTLELWADPDNDGDRSCCSAQAVRGARTLAHDLGMPHFSIDLREEFRAGVVEPWMAEHLAGLTPNPCVRCNGRVRLDAMIELADRVGAATLATGHYARVEDGLLRAAVDESKDQSYMLAALKPSSIARLRFPLGDMRKPQVRELAQAKGLSVAKKPDSQDLCFLAGTARKTFLARHAALAPRPGDVVTSEGTVIAQHNGQHEYTVGQRRGLGVGGGEPLYVLAKDAIANTVTVGHREELDVARVSLRDTVVHRAGADRVKLRYRQEPLACRITSAPDGGKLTLELIEPAAGIAPGQLAALYDGDVVVGHGTIV